VRHPRATRLPAAVVFDCDGTLADSESLSNRAWSATLAARGYRATDADFEAVIGHPFPQNWAYFSARAELGEPTAFRSELRERFRALFDAELELHADAVTTLRTLAREGVPIAVASSSTHAHVVRVLERGALTPLVRVVVGADDVERHKPDPEPYLAAARELGVPPAHCSAVEDTPVGIASARGAGMYTVGIVRAHGDPETLMAAHLVVDELTPAVLVRPDRPPTSEGTWS
jgi:HAD superfamily hydrolase (TIGR01509 family)